jgi:hypothetical protein
LTAVSSAAEIPKEAPKKGAPAKPDPKAAGKPAGKPGAVVDDKNVPKDNKIDYPDIEGQANFLILEKTYNQ